MGVKGGVGRRGRIGRRRILRTRLFEQRSRPVLSALVDVRELREREGLPDAAAELGGDDSNVVVQTRVTRRVASCRLEPSRTFEPLLTRELHVHGVR
jgi:hypothetical protein